MRDLIFAGFWIVLFPATFVSAHIGVLLWIWLSLSSPNDRLYGFLSGVPFNKITAVITVLGVLFSREKKKFYVDTFLLLYTIFIIWAIIANTFSLVTNDYAEQSFEKILKEAALVVAITGTLVTRSRMHNAIFSYCIAVGLVSSFEAAAFIVSGTSHRVIGIGATGDNNGVALAALMAAPLGYYLLQYTNDRIMRMGLIALITSNIVTVIATFSRGGFIGLLVLVAYSLSKSKRKLLYTGALVAIVMAALFVLPETYFARIDSIKDADANSSFLGRVMAWQISFLMALDHPFTGGGFQAVAAPGIWASYLQATTRLGIIPNVSDFTTPHAAHSIYFEVLGDMGFIGFLSFMGTLLISLLNCQRAMRLAKLHPSTEWAADLSRMMLLSIILYMVSGAALSFAYYEGIWIVVAMASRLLRTLQDESVTRLEAEAEKKLAVAA